MEQVPSLSTPDFLVVNICVEITEGQEAWRPRGHFLSLQACSTDWHFKLCIVGRLFSASVSSM